MEVWKFQEVKKSKNPWSSQAWKSGKENSFWKKSKNPLIPLCGSLKIWDKWKKIQKSLIFKRFCDIYILSFHTRIRKNPKIHSCQGYPWNPWGNFFQLVTVIPRGEHHLLQAVKACPLHCLAGISSLYVLKLGDQFKTKKLFGDMKNILLYKNYFGRGPPLVVILYLQSWWGKWLYDIFKALISARN